MDWYSWLSKSNLEDGLVYEYSLLFSHNELEEEDIVHFNHEFLQSMGISVAKHRLEILKVARKSKSAKPVARILTAMRKTKRCLAKYIHSLVHRDNSAIVVVPRPSYGGARWKGAMLKRNKRLALLKQGRLMLTDGGVKVARPNSVSYSASPVVYNNKESEKGGDEDGYWGSSTEEIRWDSMFQDLKPT
ncbi:hypothetical protein COCNU_01G017510 [Cocos nucifera]|uniref:SAM domain-containing protein n=1 Tax=Cocos nucifera TaxID=13894 RepID=A0A8K0HWD1_COCNU|nr:hypothetical protein COCNU_01G017510 [Cocos nucifera]